MLGLLQKYVLLSGSTVIFYIMFLTPNTDVELFLCSCALSDEADDGESREQSPADNSVLPWSWSPD